MLKNANELAFNLKSWRVPGLLMFNDTLEKSLQYSSLWRPQSVTHFQSRNLPGLGARNKKMGNRGQVFAKVKVDSGTVCLKFAEIWAELPYSQ